MYLFEKSVVADETYQIINDAIAMELCKPCGTSRRSRSGDNNTLDLSEAASVKLIEGI